MGIPHHRVVIVGTGFSGLGMAIRLAQRGEWDFVLLEKAEDVGGTWRDNRYPGCACDVPSRLYSFSFDQKPDWSRDFATADEIWDYLRDVADRYAVRERVEFGTDLASAVFDEGEQRWSLAAVDGRQWTADAVVMGVGALHEPRQPDIPGLDTFGGPVFHSARWPDDDGLDGRRVAVVGTGASSVQIIPALAPRTDRLTVFQRTPAWILPKHDQPWSPRRKRLFARYPALQRAVRWRTYWSLESRAPLFTRAPTVARLVERYALRQLHSAVSDPELRRRLTPDYTIGCKRILLSNDYWPSFERDDVDLVTDPIARIEPRAVVTASGARHDVDALVLGTGFEVSGSFQRIDIRGREGRTLAQVWSSGMHSHLGITVSGFPELYLLLGPNTGLGHNSVVLMIEFATRYVLECLERGRSGARDTTPEAQSSFTREMRRRSRHTVWASGCRSWYLDRFGNNTAVWPGSSLGYWWRTRRVDDGDFEPVRPAVTPQRPAPQAVPTAAVTAPAEREWT
jgi:cation diffusion facilitator CzcD-associated flavoprotein CzcO